MRFDLLTDMSAHWARETPVKAAVIFGDQRWTYTELHERVIRTVAALRAAGVNAGDRVGHLGLNHPDFVVLMQACIRIGAILVPINWRLVAAEIAFMLRDAGIRVLITDSAFLPSVEEARAETPIEAVILTDGPEAFAAWAGSHPPDHHGHAAEPETVALQLYTSGTTGFPKGALLTHGSLTGTIAKGPSTGEPWSEWSADDVCLVAMPLYHIGGAGWALHALAAGATAVILPRPDIPDIVAAVETHGVTKMFAVPAVMNMIVAHRERVGADLGSVRALLYGASPIPLDVLKRSMGAFPNASFIQCYGATETSGTVVYLPPDDHHPEGTPRMAGCGKPFPGNEIRIVDAEGRTLPPRAVGEIAIRSVSNMAGYHNNPDATAKAMRDGWYLSGDAGWMDEDGYLYIHDRVKDMIVSGAENIYPAEVENALHNHPAVADCAVIGVPDDKWGEAVKAVVVLKPGHAADAGALIAHARTRIAGYKVPKSIDFVDALPRNPSGKILKRELRKAYWPEGGRMVN